MKQPPKSKLLAAEPQLFATDIAASCRFYVEKLGFEVDFIFGEPAFYAQVKRDGVSLNLRHLDAPAIDSKLRGQEQLLSATITVEDIDQLYAEFQATHLMFPQALKTEPWRARTFIVGDPDGNLLLFAGS